MRFWGRYFYVYAFAAFFIGFAVSVARDPELFVERIRPAVHDSVAIMERVQGFVRQANAQLLQEEAVELFVHTIRLPSSLLERVSEILKKVEADPNSMGGQYKVSSADADHADESYLEEIPKQ